MRDSFSEIKLKLEEIVSLLEETITSQKEEIEQLKRRLSALEERPEIVSEKQPTPDLQSNREVQSTPKVPIVKETPEFSLDDDVDFEIKDSDTNYTLGELFSPKNSIADNARQKELPWMEDMPGPAVDRVEDAITLNDKLFFIRELFDGDEEQFALTLERIDETSSLHEIIGYIRSAFPQWDELSEPIYRFYMYVRRKCSN